MLNQADFLIAFPEFEPAAASGLVQAKLDEAADSISASIYRDQTDNAHGNLAAHLLALSPFGRNARLVDDTGSTQYFRRYQAIRREKAPRGFVT